MTRRTRWILVVTAIVLLLVAAGVAVAVWARGVESAAIAGKTQAEAGVRSLASMDATAAASQFEDASNSFAATKRALGPDWFAAVATAIPWAGRQYAAVRTLAEIGLDGSAAGADLSGLIKDASASSGTTDTTGRIGGILFRGHGKVEAAVASLVDATDRASGLSADGLAGPLGDAVTSVKSMLRHYAPLLRQGRALLPVLSYFASGDRRILVVSQDGAELRPAGGFAGSFGIIEVGPAGFHLESYHDVYVLPMPSPPIAAPPGALMNPHLSFRDANWWIDFPTSAREMLGLWHIQKQAPVDGIVAIDTVTIEDLLAATGPISVPGYSGEFTSANLLTRLLDIVEIDLAGQPDRKNVLSALASQLETRLLGSSVGELAKAGEALSKAADAKHLQVYFTDPSAEAAVEALGWSGRVAPPAGTTDVLAVSNAMNKAGKANAGVWKSIEYEVAFQPDRSADTTLVLDYSATKAYPKQLQPIFRDWLRVYREPGTIFPPVTAAGRKTVTTVEFGFPAEVRTFTLSRGQSHVETLTARVPDALRVATVPGAASGDSADYRLHLVRQDDLEDIPTTITVTAPPGWRVTGASARFTASGAPVPVTVESDSVRVAVPLSGDLDLDVRFASS